MGARLVLVTAEARGEFVGDLRFLGGVPTEPIGAAERVLDSDAAVGLLRRSAELLPEATFFMGAGACGALRDRAREAAVGAYNPEDGVLGRDAPVEGDMLPNGRACFGVPGFFGVADRGTEPAADA